MSINRNLKERLIVSFIGNTDIKFFPPQDKDCSPILRLLLALHKIEPGIPAQQTRLLLFDDDKVGKTVRAVFCEALEAVFPEYGFTGLQLDRHKIQLPEGPTDLHALYENARSAISPGKLTKTEVIFHISSGSPAMGFTLLLAANCLPLNHVRIFETSAEQGVKEVRPPYILAARENYSQQRAACYSKELPVEAIRALAKHTVIEDPQVNLAYSILFESAASPKIVPVRLLIKGPGGSGKWHAAQQFVKWRDKPATPWLHWDDQPAIEADDGTLLIRHLNTWPENALVQLGLLAARKPDVAIVATFRTDQAPATPIKVLARDGLRAAVQVELPSLGVRNDIVQLGLALAEQMGIATGKLRTRLSYEWLTDLYPNNLHDLKRLLINTAAYSDSMHPDSEDYRRISARMEGERTLDTVWRILNNLEFGQGQPTLDELLAQIRYVTLQRLRDQSMSQAEIAERVGMSQTTVSDVLKARKFRQ